MKHRFAYYCSGHGFGHATRVTAITLQLISAGHTVHIITSAPRQVFDSVLDHSSDRVSYRHTQLEPTVVQPKAYDVDRWSTFKNLQRFIKLDRSRIIDQEAIWLIDRSIDCVLIDAPFVPCAAAEKAGIRSVIISNFTFCSCYSYLSTPFEKSHPHDPRSIESKHSPDPLIPQDQLDSLVKIVISDYSKSQLLLRLPGSIPIPAFDREVELPSSGWVDRVHHTFEPHIQHLLDRPTPPNVIDIPLVVRPISSPDIYQPNQKLQLLERLGVHETLRTDPRLKILLVSFGGQTIPRPVGSEDHPSGLLPPHWIALVCGISTTDHDHSPYPDRFYPISQDLAYLPDLTALADVVLGKLGYGTCSETLATMTPLVYVPRPMFVEEYGLKRLMKRNVTMVEMERDEFEGGLWSEKVLEADRLGRLAKLEFIRNRSSKEPNEGVKEVVIRLENFLALSSSTTEEVRVRMMMSNERDDGQVEVDRDQRPSQIFCSS